MKKCISKQTISRIVKTALKNNLISDQKTSAVFFDLYEYENRLKELSDAFPTPVLNAVAVKANPVISILKLAAQSGFGAECASMGELMIAQKAGFDISVILYDSPAKTLDEIKYCLKKHIYLNIDNEQELLLVIRLIENGLKFRGDTIGLRINPELSLSDFNRSFTEVEKKTITGLKSSKFGVPFYQAKALLTNNDKIKEIITGLHLHIGSQRCPIEMILEGIKRVVNLADRLNADYGFKINTVDIGGGLPVRYDENDRVISFGQLANMLYQKIPHLKNYRVITEFGRSIFADLGWVASKVEYTKTVRDENDLESKIAIIHIGGDMFVRTAYMDWYHNIIMLNSNGSVRKSETTPQSIAGPLCFSGDFIARNRQLPLIQPGDWVVIRDAGAYTFSMWSHYNSRTFPPLYGYDKSLNISTLHKGHSIEDTVSFWL